jgi:tetratricopeptide (TPR) repeat protein
MESGELLGLCAEAKRAEPRETAARGPAVRLIAPMLAAAALACAPPPTPETELPNTPARMSDIVSALEVALPYAQDQDAFASPAAREEIRGALRALRRNASALELHGGDLTPGFAFFSKRLADDAAEISARFNADSHDEARFLLNELANDCAGCHVRLPDAAEHTVGTALVAKLANVRPQTRARLLVATRQFDAALASWEASFASRAATPSALDFDGAIEDFLVVSLRVRSDFARAERGLATLLDREDVPRYLAQLLAGWRASLGELSAYQHSGTLVEAREVLRQAEAQRRYPADRAALVHDLVASALLHRALAGGLASPDERAEASYLLGLAELRSDPSRQLPQAEAYLEAAIRAAPGSGIAQDAYAVLEEQTVLGWSGSGGFELPSDVRDWLAELHAIADGGRARP